MYACFCVDVCRGEGGGWVNVCVGVSIPNESPRFFSLAMVDWLSVQR